jgi:hypothetical protein
MCAHPSPVGAARAAPGTATNPTAPAHAVAITNDFISAPIGNGELGRRSSLGTVSAGDTCEHVNNEVLDQAGTAWQILFGTGDLSVARRTLTGCLASIRNAKAMLAAWTVVR